MTNQSDRRFEAACAAMQGMLANGTPTLINGEPNPFLTSLPIEIADALLAKLAETTVSPVDEEKKPREWFVESFDNRNGPYRAWHKGETLMHYTGEKPRMDRLVTVREVLK